MINFITLDMTNCTFLVARTIHKNTNLAVDGIHWVWLLPHPLSELVQHLLWCCRSCTSLPAFGLS